MPRLLQRARRPDVAPSRRTADEDAGPLQLPPYEPPTHPMDDRTKQKVAAMYNSRDVDSARRAYEKHLSKSSTYLFETVGSINDVLFARKRSLNRMVEKRRAQGIEEKPETEVSLEQYVAELEAVITELTDSSEEALRQVIDCRAELEDQAAVLEMVVQGLNAQQQRPDSQPRESRERRPKRRGVDSDDDEEIDGASGDDTTEQPEVAVDAAPPILGVRDLLENARKAKMDEYTQLTAHQRYALNNDYISFKKNWHDALHPEDQIPLPDPSTWFDEHGRPTKGAPADANQDDDLVVEREIIDLKCPLSLQMMKEPFSNHQCKHTFEKTAIMEFIRSNRGVAKCPVCSKDLRIKDLYLDEVILRRIKRAEQAARRGDDDTSDIEPEEDVDTSVIIGRSISIKKERRPRRMEEIDSE
ncbi:hypothetical protein VTK26DRAFT_1023 [Humicola hyalothermophila]